MAGWPALGRGLWRVRTCRLLADGVDIRVIQQILKHSDVKQSRRDLNVTDEEVHKTLSDRVGAETISPRVPRSTGFPSITCGLISKRPIGAMASESPIREPLGDASDHEPSGSVRASRERDLAAPGVQAWRGAPARPAPSRVAPARPSR
jgi:hypothetical protein